MGDNMKSSIKRIINWFFNTGYGNRVFFRTIRFFIEEKSKIPKVVRIESTNMCNGRCVFCPHSKQTRKIGIMSFGTFKKIIKQCKEIGVNEVHFQNFGEPLFDSELFRKIRYAKDMGIKKTVIYSNGSLFTERNINSMIDSGLDELFISFEGYTKEIYENLRKGLSFDSISNNIRNLSVLRTDKPRIIIKTVYSEKYRKYKQSFEDYWRVWVDEIDFQRIHNWSEGEDCERKSICNAFWNYMTITWNGRVLSCCLDWDAKHIMGNANKEKLIDIWNNNRYRTLRRIMLWGYSDALSLCNGCSLLKENDVYSEFLKFVLI